MGTPEHRRGLRKAGDRWTLRARVPKREPGGQQCSLISASAGCPARPRRPDWVLQAQLFFPQRRPVELRGLSPRGEN